MCLHLLNKKRPLKGCIPFPSSKQPIIFHLISGLRIEADRLGRNATIVFCSRRSIEKLRQKRSPFEGWFLANSCANYPDIFEYSLYYGW